MTQSAAVDVTVAQDQFTQMMPEIERIAGRAFGKLDREGREEAVTETLALCWKNHLHCTAVQKAISAPSLAHYAILGVKSGRSLCGQSSTDVLAKRTRLLGRAHVQSLSAARAVSSNPGWWDCSEALVDSRVWERPLERVRIRHDYGAFLRWKPVTQQEREVFKLITLGNGTKEIAEKLEVSAPRVCQLKGSLGRKLAGFMGKGG